MVVGACHINYVFVERKMASITDGSLGGRIHPSANAGRLEVKAMSYNLLDERYLDQFNSRLDDAEEVCIASAWMTESMALTALINSGCRARAIVGTYGNATTPASLNRFVGKFGLSNLRLAKGSRLFHPKLYLFIRPRKTVAWIGSANFTSGGLDSNQELIVELDGAGITSRLQSWFDDRWCELPSRRMRQQLDDYAAGWRRPGRDLAGIVNPKEAEPSGDDAGVVVKITFRRKRDRGKRNYAGTVVCKHSNGRMECHTYEVANDALRIVLCELRRGRRWLLTECSKNQAFRVDHTGGKGSSLLLSNDKAMIKEERLRAGKVSAAQRKRVIDRGIYPKDLGSFAPGWWLSRDTTPAQVWKMVCAAAEVAKIQLVPDRGQSSL